MTYAELFAKLVEDVPAGRSFSIEVSTWRHSHDPVPTTTWTVYIASERGHSEAESIRFDGPTAESTYAAFVASCTRRETLEETSDNVNPDAIAELSS